MKVADWIEVAAITVLMAVAMLWSVEYATAHFSPEKAAVAILIGGMAFLIAVSFISEKYAGSRNDSENIKKGGIAAQ